MDQDAPCRSWQGWAAGKRRWRVADRQRAEGSSISSEPMRAALLDVSDAGWTLVSGDLQERDDGCLAFAADSPDEGLTIPADLVARASVVGALDAAAAVP